MLCDICRDGECQNGLRCSNPVFCTCRCNVGGFNNMAQKVASIGRGLLVAGVGLFFILTPFGGPVLGAGISSTIKGIEKTIKEEKIDTKDYCLEVGFGAATGALTGGIGAVGEAAVAQTTKEVAKVGARLTAGTACSVLNKVFDESKQCLKGEKDLKNWGKSVDADGNEKGALATAGSWLGGAALGLGGGAVSQVSGGLSSLTNSEVGKFATRVTTETVGNTLIDVGCQGINVLTGEQEKIDLTRTAMRAGTTLTSVAVREGIRMGQNTSWEPKGKKSAVVPEERNEAKISELKRLKDEYEVYRDILTEDQDQGWGSYEKSIKNSYNCNLKINQKEFSILEISQYYKNKPGRSTVSDEIIGELVKWLQGREFYSVGQKDNYHFFEKEPLYIGHRAYNLIWSFDDMAPGIITVINCYRERSYDK